MLDVLGHALLPSAGNSYRPYLLRKESLAFFLGVVVAAEGLLVASLFGLNPSQALLTASAIQFETAPAAPGTVPSLLAQMALAASDPAAAADWALGAVAVVLAVLLVLAVVLHIRIQPTHLILPGAAVLLLALFLLWVNVTYQGTSSGDRGLAAPGPAQYHW